MAQATTEAAHIPTVEDLPEDVRERQSKTFDVKTIRKLLRDCYYYGPIPEGEGGKRDVMANGDWKKGTGLRRSKDGALWNMPGQWRSSVLRKAVETDLIVESDAGYMTTEKGRDLLLQLDRCSHCGRVRRPVVAESYYRRSPNASAMHNSSLVTRCPECDTGSSGVNDKMSGSNSKDYERQEEHLENSVKVAEQTDGAVIFENDLSHHDAADPSEDEVQALIDSHPEFVEGDCVRYRGKEWRVSRTDGVGLGENQVSLKQLGRDLGQTTRQCNLELIDPAGDNPGVRTLYKGDIVTTDRQDKAVIVALPDEGDMDLYRVSGEEVEYCKANDVTLLERGSNAPEVTNDLRRTPADEDGADSAAENDEDQQGTGTEDEQTPADDGSSPADEDDEDEDEDEGETWKLEFDDGVPDEEPEGIEFTAPSSITTTRIHAKEQWEEDPSTLSDEAEAREELSTDFEAELTERFGMGDEKTKFLDLSDDDLPFDYLFSLPGENVIMDAAKWVRDNFRYFYVDQMMGSEDGDGNRSEAIIIKKKAPYWVAPNVSDHSKGLPECLNCGETRFEPVDEVEIDGEEATVRQCESCGMDGIVADDSCKSWREGVYGSPWLHRLPPQFR